MKDLFIVAKFTIKDMIKRKSFIISNLIILLFIVIGFNIPNIMDLITGKNTPESGDSNSGASAFETKMLIVDSENIFENTLTNLNEMSLGYNFTISNENLSFDNIKQKIILIVNMSLNDLETEVYDLIFKMLLEEQSLEKIKNVIKSSF